MNFQFKTWHQYRKQSMFVGKHIAAFKDDTGAIHLEKKELEAYVAQITAILLECSEYMDKCGLTAAPPLWKYNSEDPNSQPSSVAFKYKDRMTKKQIKAYGKGFMMEPVPEPKKAV
jgi:hypothetical protein